MEEAIKKCVEITGEIFPNSFINTRNELILEPKNNIYFMLEDVKTVLEFKCKMIAWLSRPSYKGVSTYWQKKILKGLNDFLGTEFTNDDMDLIYTKLGKDCNRKLTIEFIESDFDLTILGNK